MSHVSPDKFSGTNTATAGKNSKDQCCMCSESVQSSMSSFGIFNSLACKMVFYHHRQPAVSEAKKSHSPALPICVEVSRLAHSDITHYQTQPLTCVVCSALIFLLPTCKNWSCSSCPGSRQSLGQKAPSAPACIAISQDVLHFFCLPAFFIC